MKFKKDIRRKVDVEDEKLSEEDKNYLEEVLYPIVEKNMQEKIAQRKKVFNPRFQAVLSIVCLCFVLGASTLLISIFSNNNFSEIYKNKESNIEYVNSNLIHTEIQCDFDYVSMVYKGKKEIPVYFSINHNYEPSETQIIMCSMNVIIDKAYEVATDLEYTQQIKFKGFDVKFNRSVETELDDEIAISFFKIKAYIDTGAERYLFNFEEFTTNDFDGFESYLNLIIAIK